MIVLHAGVNENRLLLWGEKPVERENRTTGRRGRKPNAPRADRLPYDAGADGLSAALLQAGVGFKVSKRQVESGIVWLLTVGKAPIASGALIAEPPRSRAKKRLAPWSVTARRLTTDETVELLCLCVGKKTLASGVIIGDDLAFWTTAMRFAGTLVARQQYMPGIAANDGVYCSRWEPVFLGPDAERLSNLAKAMPAVARALSREATSPPDVSSASVLSGFVAETVDHLVRPTLSTKPQPTKPRRGRKKKPPAFDSIHDQWLHALRSPDGAMGGDEAELAKFAAQVREWQRPISVTTASPFRLCFRLEEPEDDEGREKAGVRLPRPGTDAWHVRYLLQAADDPSLLVKAKQAWTAAKRKSSVLKRGDFKPREYMLSSLGQASGLCPHIERSLKSSRPGGYKLDATGAHEFLTEKALALEQAGFGVMLPAWWTGKGTKLRLTVGASIKSPKMQASSGLSLEKVIRFDWEIAIGKQKLSLEELEALAKLKAPLVKVRGQWVHMTGEEIQAALDLWKKKGKDSATLREIVQMSLGATKAQGTIAFEGVRATGWVGDLLSRLERRAFATDNLWTVADRALPPVNRPIRENRTLSPLKVAPGLCTA